MSDGVFLLDEGGELLQMTESQYDSEALLQELLERHPALLAGSQLTPTDPRRWLLVQREIGIASEEDGSDRWALDHLFLDQDGIPTLVEVKRSTDTRMRREVVGQMLDYAANAILYWPVEKIRTAFEHRCMEAGEDPDQIVQELGAVEDPEEFWQAVKTNLHAGRVRLLFVADLVPNELKRIVEFLNDQMDPAEALAVEIRQYTGEGLKAMAPRVIGQTAEAERRKSAGASSRRNWDENSFFEDASSNLAPAELEAVRNLYEWSTRHADRVTWGTGAQRGSFSVKFDRVSSKSVLSVLSDGDLWLNFRWLDKPEATRAFARRLGRDLAEMDDLEIPEDFSNRHPEVPVGNWAPHVHEITAILEQNLRGLQGSELST